MKRTLRLLLAVIAGLVVGSVVNMALVMAGGMVFPLPPGADVSSREGLQASLHLFQPRHFLFPLLAHSLGTLAGAWVATLLAPGRTRGPAWVVGLVFLLGGIANVVMLPAPAWFSALDLALAYGPPAWLGHWLGARTRRPATARPEGA